MAREEDYHDDEVSSKLRVYSEQVDIVTMALAALSLASGRNSDGPPADGGLSMADIAAIDQQTLVQLTDALRSLRRQAAITVRNIEVVLNDRATP
jgi:hypothetical protein